MKRIRENAVTMVHRLVRDAVRPGDVVIDATVGTGRDTQFLSECVGSTGTVYGFDVQQAALDAAQSLLNAQVQNVQLFLAGHETMIEHIPAHHHGCVRTVMFNLGYLPRGERTITTAAPTTRQALGQALRLLAPGGLITIVCYSHPEGHAEMQAVRNELATLSQREYTCLQTDFFNQQGNPPVVFAVYCCSLTEYTP